MLITENFALLDILKAFEKLSAVTNDKKSAEITADKSEEFTEQSTESKNNTIPKKNLSCAENLIERHEQLVNRIKSGKK